MTPSMFMLAETARTPGRSLQPTSHDSVPGPTNVHQPNLVPEIPRRTPPINHIAPLIGAAVMCASTGQSRSPNNTPTGPRSRASSPIRHYPRLEFPAWIFTASISDPAQNPQPRSPDSNPGDHSGREPSEQLLTNRPLQSKWAGSRMCPPTPARPSFLAKAQVSPCRPRSTGTAPCQVTPLKLE